MELKKISGRCIKVGAILLSALLAVGPIGGAASAHDSNGKITEPDWSIDQVVNEMRDTWMGGTVKEDEMVGEVKEFNMYIDEFQHELTDGTVVTAWGFGLEGQPASVPGPTLRVKQGDLVRIHLRNATTQPHSLHSHGITSLDMLNDGVPHITGAYIMPGETFTYEFVVKEAGTHWYHCHVQTSLHQDMGMYGALIVEERDNPSWDKEFVMMVDEWDTHRDPAKPTEIPTYNYFTVNGKSGTSVPDMHIGEGEIGRVRLINAGFQNHSLHLHGTHFLVTHKDGYPVPTPYSADTLDIAPGETYDLFVKGRDGVWPWHDHNSLAATNAGQYPGGMLMHVRGDGDNKFNPKADPPRIPLEGHIHQNAEGALISEGDPQFLREKMAANSANWKKATAAERERIHEQNMKYGAYLGGVYNSKTGVWTFSEEQQAPEHSGTEQHSGGIELGAMAPPVVTPNAVTPLKTLIQAKTFNPEAPPQPVKGKIVEVKLEAVRAKMEVAPGDIREVWTFNGSVPAPVIRVHQGDSVKITLVNKDPEMSHGLDFHAGQMDMGTFHKAIKPGEQMTFQFKANYAGIFYFHCSADPVIMHIANGMFGAVIVDPPGYEPSGKEFVVIENEWYKAGADMQELINGKPVAVALNGKAQQYVDAPLKAKSGENIRFYFINAGINDFSAWHVIGEIFDKVYNDGNPKNEKTGVQTVLVPPGGAIITDMKAEPGKYLMLTHQMNNAMRGGLGYLEVE